MKYSTVKDSTVKYSTVQADEVQTQRAWEVNYREAAIFLEEGQNNDKFIHHPRYSTVQCTGCTITNLSTLHCNKVMTKNTQITTKTSTLGCSIPNTYMEFGQV